MKINRLPKSAVPDYLDLARLPRRHLIGGSWRQPSTAILNGELQGGLVTLM